MWKFVSGVFGPLSEMDGGGALWLLGCTGQGFTEGGHLRHRNCGKGGMMLEVRQRPKWHGQSERTRRLKATMKVRRDRRKRGKGAKRKR